MGTKSGSVVTMTFTVLLTATLLLGAVPAFAGKPERDKADELKGNVDAAVKAISSACGCEGKVTVDWSSYTSADTMARIGDVLQSVQDAATGYCEKPADKQAFCANITEFAVKFSGTEIEPLLTGKTVAVQSNDSSYVSADQIRAILDKF